MRRECRSGQSRPARPHRSRLRQGEKRPPMTARISTFGALAALALLSFVPAAEASTVTVNGSGTLLYQAVAGETNVVSVSRGAANYLVTDSVPLVAAAPCLNVVATVAACPVAL